LPRITISTGSTPIGFWFQTLYLDGARVNFSEPVGEIIVQVNWGDDNFFDDVTVDQITGEITAAHVYQRVGVYNITILAATDEGDEASAEINALVN
jgi:hypothetical protein